ncbi:MAG TPA: Panacea domain-containing protein [Bryobacteraceae bacterium]|nr:Panacea domain-containing protein [Bryobacteraceae bacterium]
MDFYALIKLLYFSDRRALSRRGRPITGDFMVSMPYGPVLSRILNEAGAPELLQNQHWSELLNQRENNSVSLKQENPPTNELSQFERDILKAEFEHYGHYGFKDLMAIAHALPEFKDPNGSSLPIDPASILREEGWTDEEIQDAAMSAREEVFFNEIGR